MSLVISFRLPGRLSAGPLSRFFNQSLFKCRPPGYLFFQALFYFQVTGLLGRHAAGPLGFWLSLS